ncbi:MAG: polysaccharide deacetylase family protein, partial [Chthoniobacteraceae bacterium]|nr:polysaccharide deacetylase family protein [Chthoniobacteraceae bacterium]
SLGPHPRKHRAASEPASREELHFMHQAAVTLIVCTLALAFPFSGCHRATPPPPAPAEPEKTAPVGEKDTSAEATPAAINRNAQVTVLGYHRVVDNVRRPDTEITKADFEAQMQQLKDDGITVIPLRDLLAWKRGEKDIPAKSAVITLDDGWKSQYEAAWPILQKYNYPFTLFIYTDYVKGGPKSGGESITWEQIAEMRDAGADIQGHTVSHKDLRGPRRGAAPTPEYETWLWHELTGSKQILEQRLGVKVDVLALPYGFYNAHVQEMAKKAGYDAIFTVYGQKIGHGSPNEALGRYMIDTRKPQIFASAIRFSGMPGASAPEAVAEYTPDKLATEPADNATIADPRPLIKANVGSFGGVDPATLSMRVSSLGAVNAKYDPATQSYSFQTPRKLGEGRYTVIVTGKAHGKKVEARWGFTVDPKTNPAP